MNLYRKTHCGKVGVVSHRSYILREMKGCGVFRKTGTVSAWQTETVTVTTTTQSNDHRPNSKRTEVVHKVGGHRKGGERRNKRVVKRNRRTKMVVFD